MGKSKKKNKSKVCEVNHAELGKMLDGVASTVKAVAMINNGDAQVVVTTFDEQVVLPEPVVNKISELLKEHVEETKPILRFLAQNS